MSAGICIEYKTPAKGCEHADELDRGGVPVAESLECWP